MVESESSFNLNCFDDDFDKHLEEINNLYEYLENHDYIELSWKCPGRTITKTEEEVKAQLIEMVPKEESAPKNMEFDFEEFEEPNSSNVKINQLNRTPKALTNKKKTTATTFSGIMEKLKKRS